jgi:uncharacterized membrane protein
MSTRWLKLVMAILLMSPLILWISFSIGFAAMDTYHLVVNAFARDPQLRTLIISIVTVVSTGLLFIWGLSFWRSYEFESEIDKELRDKMGPDNYKAFSKFMGIRAHIKRWLCGTH